MRKNTDFSDSSNRFHSHEMQTPLYLSDFGNKKVEVNFTQEQISNDGGLLLLHEVDKQISLINRLAACINDNRHQSYIDHTIVSMISQRVMQIAAGYEDANDCNTMRDDGILKICAGNEQTLASQPTMSRLENLPAARQLYEMSKVIVDIFISSYPQAPKVIVLDCDDTSALAYGKQQLSLFNQYYGDHCFMPLHIYEGLSGKLIAAILKPGRRSKSTNVFSLLRRVIDYLRQYWPDTLIILRGDGHFCSKEFMDWSQDQKAVKFITGITANSVLNRHAEATRKRAEKQYKRYGKPVKLYHNFEYKANTWDYSQQVVVKVEVNSMGTNVRYIVSNLRNSKAKILYEQLYCARGAAELRIKDHKTYLRSDRMSCNSFFANQFRLLLHSAAYVLIHTLQNEVLKGTEYCKSTMKTIQLKLIKVAARVKIMKTKVKIELPVSFYSRWVFEKSFAMFEVLRL